MKGIYLLLGSNLGDSLAMLRRATGLIEESIGKVIASSSIYSTKAWGIEDQPDFLNQIIEIESSKDPRELLIKVNEIEEHLGRIRHIKWHSRIIDIDILYYGDLVMKTRNLVIPHPENENRRFVLVPMLEIAPEFEHPELLITQRQMLDKCEDFLEVKKFE